jgi:hypothetical protein
MKALKALVIGMGVLILVGLAVVVAAIVSKFGGGDTPAEVAGPRHLDLPEGCRIAAMTATEDRLALRVTGPVAADCARILLIDPDTGKVTATLRPGAPPATKGQ